MKKEAVLHTHRYNTEQYMTELTFARRLLYKSVPAMRPPSHA